MTWKCTSILRTCSVSRIQREVIQQKGHAGSNQKSARTRPGAVWALASAVVVRLEVTQSPVCRTFKRPPTYQSHRSAIRVKQNTRRYVPGIEENSAYLARSMR